MNLKIDAKHIGQIVNADVANVGNPVGATASAVTAEPSVSPTLARATTAKPLRAEARAALHKTLVSDSAFEAFCSDYFPSAYGLFAGGMDRDQKTTILLDRADPAEVLSCLQQVAR